MGDVDDGGLSSGDGDDVCPYQGLAPFEAERTELFFGRARTTRGLLERLGPRLEGGGSILLVSGASGVGKSSLFRAGLLPALAKGLLPVTGSRHWPRLLITPTSRPLRALAESWTEAYGGRVETVHERLRDDPQQAVSGSAGRFVLVVDQFEELFTLVTDEQERQAFVRALDAMARKPPGAAVIIGLRADYWDRCAAYPQFAVAIQDGQVIVEPMTEPDLRLAITGPAAAAGLEIEPGLVETVLDELRVERAAGDRYEAGALPLLSQALRNTWDKRENGRLTIRGYEESGRVRDSVRRTADEVLHRLPAEDRKTAFKLFRRMTLITAGGRVARRRATLAEIHAAASARSAERRARVDALLSAFADQRLLTLYEDTVEIAHDALLTAWPTLRQWLEPDLAAQAVYDRLIEDAGQWAEHHRDPAFLYRGARLLSVQDTRPRWDRDPDSFPPPGPTVEGFVAASTRAARRAARRRGLVMAGLAVLSVLALIAAGAAIDAASDADHQRGLAVSRQLAAQSEVVGDPVLSALLAVAAWRIAPTAEAHHRMLAAAVSTGHGVLIGHRQPVGALTFSPDGSIIATGSRDGTVRLWDAAARRQLGAPIVPPRHECVTSGGVKVAFSPDGRVLASACLGTVRFWDVSTRQQLGAPLGARPGDGDLVSAIAYGPDGMTLAIGSLRGTVRLWDVAARRPRGNAMGRPGGSDGQNAVNAVVFGPDGKRLATAGADDTARLWNTATYRQIGAPFTGHTDDVRDVAFSPDGTALATASTDGTARLWDLATHRQSGAALKEPAGKAGFYGIAFSPDGTRIATAGGDGSTRLWDVASRRQAGAALAHNRFMVRRVAFSPDGRLLAVGGEDGAVRLWDPVTHQQTGGAIPALSVIALSPDGRTLAAGGPSRDDPATRLWDVATQRPVGRPLEPTDGPPPGDGAFVHDIRFDPDGRTLMTAGPDGVRMWDAAGRRQIGSPVYAERGTGAVQLSPDGRFLAVQHAGSILFWEVAGRREIGPRIRIPGHTEVISAMAISPDGATLATAGYERRVRVFDVATRRQIGAPLPVATNGFFDDLAFSPDGSTLAVTAEDPTVRLWDLAGRRPVGAALTGHTSGITAIAFSPDGKALVTGSADDTVRLWDLQTHRQIGTPLTGHTRAVTGISYSRDGATVATVSDDGTARLWSVALPTDPVAAACTKAGRSLTRAEWERYAPQEKFRRTCR
jgi:WD40 repeat protein